MPARNAAATVEELYTAVVDRLLREGRAKPPPSSSRDLDAYWRHHIRMPDVRRIVSSFATAYRMLPASDQLRLTQLLLEEGSNEGAHVALLLLGKTIDRHERFLGRALDEMVEAFLGWAVTDTFCTNVLHPILLRFPTETLDLLPAWAASSKRWKRRASVVAFARKVGATGAFTQQGLVACERLIGDEDDLVRKGIGWALKDMMKGEKQPVLEYVANLRRRGVSSTITLYAIRDLVCEERARILSISPNRSASG